MRYKELVINKLELIDNQLKSLNYSIGRLDRNEAYTNLDRIKSTLEEIKTLINGE